MPKARKPTIVPRGEQGSGAASPNLEQYVETIAHLLTKDKVCTVSEIAAVAQVTRPAASRAVRDLAEKDLVVHKAYSYVDLTNAGRKLAEQLSRRHDVLLRFLQTVLQYDEPEADREACRLEHQIDDELAGRLQALTRLFAEDASLLDRVDFPEAVEPGS
jgi:DtxR family Mn-dependent transcriptional regulator